MKNRGIAIVLCIFLGGLGIHRFYLGQIGTGFLYLIFFWTFIPALLAIIDILRLVFMNEQRFQNIYK